MFTKEWITLYINRDPWLNTHYELSNYSILANIFLNHILFTLLPHATKNLETNPRMHC